MKIKKLELIGFKSFVDRTIVKFDHDVLGIVGPNGCGKSNIVDAIRWCMGEQSAKHLRGRSMEDVIFNGSESRSPNEFAEVTLTFENDTPDDVPLEYRDYAEIAVTRRLSRTGESEYLINKTTVRLRDITELFLGTGVGTKAYSIIEQGKVGLIVSAKAEDRRLLIEEAAGITKYKARKRQAERKMDLTRQNLLRVGDIVSEIERNLSSLKRQAAKAERFLAYRTELEDLQLYDASHRYLETTAWIRLETARVAEGGERFETVRRELDTAESAVDAIRQDVLRAEEDLEAAQTASFAADNLVQSRQADIARAKDRLVGLHDRDVQARTELIDIEKQMVELAGERDALGVSIEGLAADDAAQDDVLARATGELNRIKLETEAADATLAGLRESVATANAAIAAAQAKLEGFEARRRDMRSRRDAVQTAAQELAMRQAEEDARAKELAQTLDDLKSGKASSAHEEQALSDGLAALRAQVPESEKKLEDARAEASRVRSRYQALAELQERREGVGSGVKALLETGDRAISGLVADRIEAPKALTQAVAALLGPRLSDVIVHDRGRGIELLASLAEARKGRATIVATGASYVAGQSRPAPTGEGIVGKLATELRYAQADAPLVMALVGDALVVEDIGVAERIRSSWTHAPIVTLAGEILDPSGRVTGGSGEDVAAHMLDTQRELRELGESLGELDAFASKCLAEHQALRATIVEAQTALEGARRRAHADELASTAAERDLSAAESSRHKLAEQVQKLETERQEIEQKLADADSERTAASSVLEDARRTLEHATAELQGAESEAQRWHESLAAQRDVVTEQKVKLAGVREKLVAARGTFTRLERSHQELEERERRLDDDIVQTASAVGQTAADLWKQNESLAGTIADSQAAKAELDQKRQAHEVLRAALMTHEASLKDMRVRVEEAREALAASELALRERELALDHLLTSVAEKFRGLELARIIGDYHLRPPPDDEIRARITDLLRLLDRMGSVNLDAMREHAEAEERYTFYSSQKDDLDRALADLERAIQQMNRESRRLFRETFEAVNAKFQEIFPKMFRGGKASLRLTNPEDMLETGIDILAQPPGKKLSSIELMSGGEKALTAVSLIFAIFQIKPSPFCILDEVDAPLDEANVARYNEMVRSMTDRSQFILITHIKRTMQMVDVLYGVTMQESGVSRIVSVKLGGAEGVKKVPAEERQEPAKAEAEGVQVA